MHILYGLLKYWIEQAISESRLISIAMSWTTAWHTIDNLQSIYWLLLKHFFVVSWASDKAILLLILLDNMSLSTDHRAILRDYPVTNHHVLLGCIIDLFDSKEHSLDEPALLTA